MALTSTVLRGAAVVLLVTGMSACQSRPEQATPTAAPQVAPAAAVDRSAPTLEELKNATYQGVEEAGGPFALTNGRWEGKPYEPGAASAPSVTFVRDFHLTSDLDGDGGQEAVVLLAAGTGGTGETSYLAVVARQEGQVKNIATAPVGDRVQVRDARIDARRIVLDVVQVGKNDAMCCPGDLVTRNWDLQAGGLEEGASATTGRLSVEVLAGAEWVLRAWAWDEPAPATPEVTLKLDGGRLAGSAGCNGYFGPVEAGSQPGDVTVGPLGATRKMCPEPAMTVETRFLQQLGGVQRIRFVAGQLALPYTKKDGSFGVMLFDRRAAQ
jgi:heat shock protein HslJ